MLAETHQPSWVMLTNSSPPAPQGRPQSGQQKCLTKPQSQWCQLPVSRMMLKSTVNILKSNCKIPTCSNYVATGCMTSCDQKQQNHVWSPGIHSLCDKGVSSHPRWRSLFIQSPQHNINHVVSGTPAFFVVRRRSLILWFWYLVSVRVWDGTLLKLAKHQQPKI